MFKVVFLVASFTVGVLIDMSASRSQTEICDVVVPPIGHRSKISVLAEGDSITFGSGATDGLGSYVSRSSLSSDGKVQLINRSQNGATLGHSNDLLPVNSLYSRLESDNLLLHARQPGEIFIITILIGRNDLVTYGNVADYLSNIGDYINALKRAGWDRVVLGTLLPSSWAPFRALRTDWNTAVLSDCWASLHHVDAIASFGEMPEMGSDEAAASTKFYADGTHPNNNGYEAMAVVFARAINSLREDKGPTPQAAGQP